MRDDQERIERPDDAESASEPESRPEVVTTRRKRPATEEIVVRAPALYGRPRRGAGCADLITVIFLLLTVLVISVTVILIANPHLSPLPPPTPPPILVIASPLPTYTPTITFTPEPPTPTIATATPTETPTPTQTATPTASPTPVVGGDSTAGPNLTAPATLVPLPGARQQFKVAAVRYIPNTDKDGKLDCNYQSIIVMVFNAAGRPRLKAEGPVTVKVVGGAINEIKITGGESRFGENSVEFFVDSKPRVTNYTVQLINQTGSPISDPVTVQTRTSCQENVLVIEFLQTF